GGAETLVEAHDTPQYEPKGEKGKSPAEPEADVDLRALQAGGDKEIDSRFVPVVQRAGGAETLVEAHDTPQYEPKGEKGKSPAEPEADLDLSALQAGIDKEIDSRFVPLAQRAGGAKIVVEAHDTPQYEPKSEKGKSAAEPEADLDLSALQAGIDKEIDSGSFHWCKERGEPKLWWK